MKCCSHAVHFLPLECSYCLLVLDTRVLFDNGKMVWLSSFFALLSLYSFVNSAAAKIYVKSGVNFLLSKERFLRDTVIIKSRLVRPMGVLKHGEGSF